ncbi:hypothetical protein PACTADRAFT_31415 [Pachysolen tannophilus NRRL Y-2460]|uniref:HTH APSES-type domain-containing protein n=1 Tax=Pachysolen tannophilus NRRL Y-2460 TaxID=669874 RepID=A0A1E4U1Y8_PACTA|nr:hypothetical protein PACTADRAFT_31415 [Pachysolen tannophilus NRRL Y-2460]
MTTVTDSQLDDHSMPMGSISDGRSQDDKIKDEKVDEEQVQEQEEEEDEQEQNEDEEDDYIYNAISGKSSFSVSGVYKASYSNIEVYEINVDGISVMRRRSDSFFNATQILKVAGFTKHQRTKILEKEVHTGVHEIVQGGYGKFQGTWIPYERAVGLAHEYGVTDLLKDIIIYNSNGVETPTKLEAMANLKTITLDYHNKNTSTTSSNNNNKNDVQTENKNNGDNNNDNNNINNGSSNNGYNGGSSFNGNQSNEYTAKPREVFTRTYSTLTENDNADGMNVDMVESPTKKFKPYSVGLGLHSQQSSSRTPNFEIFEHDLNIPNPNAPFSLEPIDPNTYHEDGVKYNLEQSKQVISMIFLSKESNKDLKQLLQLEEHELYKINYDVPFDDSGNTSLHWAATLGDVPLVKQLVKYGSNRIRGNNEGESALVRAVLVTNSSENSSFDNLLDYLYPCITLLDHQGRTILHHIALTSGVKGRSSASKYYLETLLEWIVRKGLYLPGNQAISLGRFMSEVVNVMDRNGDTCLNIAARIGSKAIVQQLLDVGADPGVANKVGLRPIDFGITIDPLNPSATFAASFTNSQYGNDNNGFTNNNHSNINSAFSANASQSSKRILESMHDMLSNLDSEFKEEINQKQRSIDEMHLKLRDATLKLSQSRRTLESLQQSEAKLLDLTTRTNNVDKAIEEEEERFKEQTKDLVGDFAQFDGDFDADEPFRCWPVYNELERKLEEILNNINEEDLDEDEEINFDQIYKILESSINPELILQNIQQNSKDEHHLIPPSIVLKARIKAYKENEQNLIEKMESMSKNLLNLENKYKKVISLSTGVKEDSIDNLLDELIKAVESDGNAEIDIGRVAGFLKQVEE